MRVTYPPTWPFSRQWKVPLRMKRMYIKIYANPWLRSVVRQPQTYTFSCRNDELEVQCIQVPHSWVALPQSQVNALLAADVELPVILRLVPLKSDGSESSSESPKDCYVSWMGSPSSGPTSIDIPSVLAQCLGLSEGQQVKVCYRFWMLEAHNFILNLIV